MKTCSKCNIEKELSKFKRYRICKDCHVIITKEYNDSRKEKMKDYYILNKDRIIETSRNSYINNREYIIDRNKKYQSDNKEERNEKISERKKSDSLFKLTTSIRNLIFISIKNSGYSKKSKVTKILGCSFEEFKLHIECQFKEGMSWENHGEWHLDHKTPISWAKSEEVIYELNHYTNFQPLWAKDNLIKGNKWSD
jgi:hypothetical protein